MPYSREKPVDDIAEITSRHIDQLFVR